MASVLPTIQEKLLAASNNEYNLTIPVGHTFVSLQNRSTTNSIRFAFAPGKVNTGTPAGPYITIRANQGVSFPVRVEGLGGDAAALIYFAGTGGDYVEMMSY